MKHIQDEWKKIIKNYRGSGMSQRHSDFATTANIYSHLDATSKVNSLSAFGGVISL